MAAVHPEVARLVVDISHHVQRVNDLAYDEVELELGGSDSRAGREGLRIEPGVCGGSAAHHGGVPERPIGTALKAVAGRCHRGFKSRLLCQ